MPIDLSQNINRWEADDLRQFTFIDTVSIPASVAFTVYNTDGSILAPTAVQSGVTVTISGGDITKGMFFVFRQLPSSRGFYTAEWKVFGSGTAQSSLCTVAREMFEIIKTEPVSFVSYGDKGNVLRVSRQLIGRGDLTEHDIQPHMEAAYGYINARLGGIAQVPFALPAPPYIAQGEEILAVYTLYGEFGGNERNEIPPSYATLRKDFVDYLTAVVDNKATLETGAALQKQVKWFTGGVDDGKPTFGRSDFEKQTIDTDVLEAEDDSRIK